MSTDCRVLGAACGGGGGTALCTSGGGAAVTGDVTGVSSAVVLSSTLTSRVCDFSASLCFALDAMSVS